MVRAGPDLSCFLLTVFPMPFRPVNLTIRYIGPGKYSQPGTFLEDAI
jgi:hypothetical protein